MGKGGVENSRKIEDVSLDIANYWTSNDFLTESNKISGTFVAFDWRESPTFHLKDYQLIVSQPYLTEINTNIDLSKTECDNFKFDIFVDFLKKNNFTFVLGLRNIAYSENNPSTEWTDRLKETLEFNEIEYDEYLVDGWPYPIPEFDVPDNIFMLRYSYDEYSKIDQLAAYKNNFETFITESEWKSYYKNIESVHLDYFEKTHSINRTRVIVLCSDIENLILHESYVK